MTFAFATTRRREAGGLDAAVSLSCNASRTDMTKMLEMGRPVSRNHQMIAVMRKETALLGDVNYDQPPYDAEEDAPVAALMRARGPWVAAAAARDAWLGGKVATWEGRFLVPPDRLTIERIVTRQPLTLRPFLLIAATFGEATAFPDNRPRQLVSGICRS